MLGGGSLRALYEAVHPGETVEKTVRLLAIRGLGHALVVDSDGRLVGVVSVKDIARRILACFESSGSVEVFNLRPILEQPVSSLASKPPLVARAGTELCTVARVMAAKGIGVVPLVDDAGRFVDAITELHFAEELLDADVPAGGYATWSIVWGEPGDTILEALGRMVEYGFRRLPLRLGSTHYIATMHMLLLRVVKSSAASELLRSVAEAATPAVTLDAATSLGVVAEAIISTSERAVLIRRGDSVDGILTERDFVKAYVSLKC